MTVEEVAKNNALQLDVNFREHDPQGISYYNGYIPEEYDSMPEFEDGDFIKIIYKGRILWVLAVDVENAVYYEFDPETRALSCLITQWDSRNVLAVARANFVDMQQIAPILEDLLDADNDMVEDVIGYLWVSEDYARFHNWELPPEEEDCEESERPRTINEIIG